MQSTDYVKYRGYFPKLRQWHMCGWIDYSNIGNTQTVLSYSLPDQGSDELLWQIAGTTQTYVQVQNMSIEFAFSSPTTFGNVRIIHVKIFGCV